MEPAQSGEHLADKASIVSMYQQLATVDTVICAAGAAKFAPLESRYLMAFIQANESKLQLSAPELSLPTYWERWRKQ